MRKRNPNDVIDDFKALLQSSLSDWRALCEQVQTNDLRKRASTDAFLNAAVGWESFLSDWHIAAINRDSSAFVADLTARVGQSIRDKWPGLDDRVALTIPKHPSLDLVRNIIDPIGANIAFGGRDKWLDRVRRELANPFRDAVLALADADHALIRANVGVCDCIAHRSKRATDAMNDALDSLGLPDAALSRGQVRIRPSGIGAYLHARADGMRRVERYHARLIVIAEALRT